MKISTLIGICLTMVSIFTAAMFAINTSSKNEKANRAAQQAIEVTRGDYVIVGKDATGNLLTRIWDVERNNDCYILNNPRVMSCVPRRDK